MASANHEKSSVGNARKQAAHFDEKLRVTANHSNKDIDTSKSHLNYNIGAETWKDMIDECERYIAQMDALYPPQRVREDRKTLDQICIPCPKEIEDMGRADEFFQTVCSVIRETYGVPVFGQVHKDEKHLYYDKEKHGMVESLYHIHCFVPMYVKWSEKGSERQGINGKHFLSKENMIRLNNAIEERVRARFGVRFNTGEAPRHQDAEKLKIESYNALDKEIKALEQQKDAFAHGTQAQMQAYQQAVDLCHSLQRTNNELKNQNTALRVENEEIRDTNENLRTENEKLRTDVHGLKTTKINLTEEVRALNEEKISLRKCIGKLRKMINDLIEYWTEHRKAKTESAIGHLDGMQNAQDTIEYKMHENGFNQDYEDFYR